MAAMTAAPASRCVDGNSFESVEYILAPRSWSLFVCLWREEEEGVRLQKAVCVGVACCCSLTNASRAAKG